MFRAHMRSQYEISDKHISTGNKLFPLKYLCLRFHIGITCEPETLSFHVLKLSSASIPLIPPIYAFLSSPRKCFNPCLQPCQKKFRVGISLFMIRVHDTVMRHEHAKILSAGTKIAQSCNSRKLRVFHTSIPFF